MWSTSIGPLNLNPIVSAFIDHAQNANHIIPLAPSVQACSRHRLDHQKICGRRASRSKPKEVPRLAICVRLSTSHTLHHMDNLLRNKICPACNRSYVSIVPAERHLRRHHPDCTDPIIILPPGAPLPETEIVCRECPHNVVFPTEAMKRKHVNEVHRTKCPLCHAFMGTRALPKHLETVHDHKISDVQVTNQTNEDPASGGIQSPPAQQFYCQEHDCGSCFPSEARLRSHVMWFHPKTTEEKDVGASSDGIPEVVGKSTEKTPAHLSWIPSISSPGRERAMQDSPHTPSLGETPVAVPPQEGYRPLRSSAGVGIQYAPGNLVNSPRTTRGNVAILPTTTTPTSLSLQCRMCDAPPTVDTRPTITTCGHLFCYGCITRYVVSNSRCPVCDDALLMYCLFKLDLPMLP